MTPHRHLGPSAPTALVTPARVEDAEAIAEIDQSCFGQATVNLAAELERPWARVWVARYGGDNGKAVALLLAWSVADELHILSIATMPEHGAAPAELIEAADRALYKAKKALRNNNILYARDGTAEYLQVYTETFDQRFFFEIVERRGYAGYGAANAPVRLAAQARLAPADMP